MTIASPQPMRPVSQGERIDILDILRGFAIFGILAVNIYGMASPNFLPGYIEPEWPWYDLPRPDSGQRLVALTLPVWAARMGLALADLQTTPALQNSIMD